MNKFQKVLNKKCLISIKDTRAILEKEEEVEELILHSKLQRQLKFKSIKPKNGSIISIYS